MRRRNRSPLATRRLAYALMALAALVGGLSGAEKSAIGMIAALALAVAAAACYVRAADILLDFDYRAVRRQSTLFAVIGGVVALLGCVLVSQLSNDNAPILIRTLGYAAIGGGLAAGLSGAIAMLWSFAGSYAGKQIGERSKEEW